MENIHLRGVNHLALMTDDMKMTMDYYREVLGIRFLFALTVPAEISTGAANRGNPPFENVRHYFFDMGNDESLAFFEIPKGTKERGDRNAIGAMQHVSFTTSKQSFEEIRRRLEARGQPYLGPIDILGGHAQSIYFYDPNDIRLEATFHHSESDGDYVLADMTQRKEDARNELREICSDEGWIEQTISHLPGD